MSRKGQYGDTTQRCAFCGKPKVSWFWSISAPYINRHYCSLECFARDNQTGNLRCMLCLLPVTLLLSISIAYAFISGDPIESVYLVLYGVFLLLQIIMSYHVYIGRK